MLHAQRKIFLHPSQPGSSLRAQALIANTVLELKLHRALTTALAVAHKTETYPSRLSSAHGCLSRCIGETNPLKVRKLVIDALNVLNITKPNFEAEARAQMKDLTDEEMRTLLEKSNSYIDRNQGIFEKYDLALAGALTELHQAAAAIDSLPKERAALPDSKTDSQVAHAAGTALIILSQALHS